jgi:ribosomal protein S18 acetylase RimI-like enzyme
MTATDLPAARALWSTAEGVELAEGDSEAELIGYLRRNPGASQVAVADGRLVGAVLAGHDGRRGFVYHLAVDPGARGHGLGRELVSRALAVLRKQGVRRVLLLVASDNAGGRAFWRRCGWEKLELAEAMGIDL